MRFAFRSWGFQMDPRVGGCRRVPLGKVQESREESQARVSWQWVEAVAGASVWGRLLSVCMSGHIWCVFPCLSCIVRHGSMMPFLSVCVVSSVQYEPAWPPCACVHVALMTWFLMNVCPHSSTQPAICRVPNAASGVGRKGGRLRGRGTEGEMHLLSSQHQSRVEQTRHWPRSDRNKCEIALGVGVMEQRYSALTEGHVVSGSGRSCTGIWRVGGSCLGEEKMDLNYYYSLFSFLDLSCADLNELHSSDCGLLTSMVWVVGVLHIFSLYFLPQGQPLLYI